MSTFQEHFLVHFRANYTVHFLTPPNLTYQEPFLYSLIFKISKTFPGPISYCIHDELMHGNLILISLIIIIYNLQACKTWTILEYCSNE